MSAIRTSAGCAARGARAPLAGTGDGHRAESASAQATAEAFPSEGAEAAVSSYSDRYGSGTGLSGMIVAETGDPKFGKMMRRRLPGPLWCARAFIRSRKAAASGERFAFIGSVAGHLPTEGSAPHFTAKAWVSFPVSNLSRELVETRINVNAQAPGLIATPMAQGPLNDPEKRAGSMEALPWARPGRPEGIAGLTVFLASGVADAVTGQTWTVDGGLTMNWGDA